MKINPLVSNVSDNNFIPHQPSVKLNHDKLSVTVGEQFTLKALDANYNIPGFLNDQITIYLKDFDSERMYTPQDFPNYDFKEIKKGEYPNSVTAVLTNPGYYNLCNTIDQLGHDPMIKSVSYIVLPVPQFLEIKWSVSDSSVLKVNTDGNSIGSDEALITALKEGKATVNLEMIVYGREKMYASCEVTVNSKSPDTGRTNNDSGVLIGLIITALFCAAFVFVQCKGYNRLKGSSK